MTPPDTIEKTVHVVDDDASLLRGVARLLRSHGYVVKTYSSAAEFLSSGIPSGPACLLLDLNMPGMTGLELQQVIADYQSRLAIVFISGQGDIPATVKAMKAGAVDFLVKPFEGKVLVAAIEAALSRSITAHALDGSLQRDWALFATLSPRERQVCLLFAQGLLNKQIAGELGTTERTIKAQRASVMRKLTANSVPDVVRLIERLRDGGRLPS
ncbi:MAG: response regulator [Candidatus Korobacteraceae bacterium]